MKQYKERRKTMVTAALGVLGALSGNTLVRPQAPCSEQPPQAALGES